MQITFHPDRASIVFFDATTIAPIDMGGGRKSFSFERDGTLNVEHGE